MVGLKVPEEKRATFMVKNDVSVNWILKANEGELDVKVAASIANNRLEISKSFIQVLG